MPTRSRHIVKLVLLAMTCGGVFISRANGQNAVTSSTPSQIVFIPDAAATSISKHPALPILYVGSAREPKPRNLVTYEANPDGTIATGSEKTFETQFTMNSTNREFSYSVRRPIVAAEGKVVLLAARPAYPAQYFAETNNNELVAISLDEKGHPSGVIKAFRTGWTGRDLLANVQWDATSRRLFFSYNLYFGWCELRPDGLPAGKMNRLPNLAYQWSWAYVPEWQQFFSTFPGASSFQISRLTRAGTDVDCFQSVTAMRGISPPGNLTVNSKLGILYVLDSQPGNELVLYSLMNDGRLTGVPRCFSIGAATAMRFDFKARLLYAFANGGVLRIFKLDGQGCPIGAPQLCNLACGEVWDALVDETTGKVYVASSHPPNVKL